MSVDSSAQEPPALPEGSDEPKYGGYSRFELELEVRRPPPALRVPCH